MQSKTKQGASASQAATETLSQSFPVWLEKHVTQFQRTQVKMTEAPRLLRLPQEECPEFWIRIPPRQRPKSWDKIDDLVVLLVRNFVVTNQPSFLGKKILSE